MIVEVNVTDPEPFAEYRKLVPATIEKYGGRFVVRGGTVETLRAAAQMREREADPRRGRLTR